MRNAPPARSVAVFAAAVALASCGGTISPATASKACDPLADDPQPITLGKVLGAGRDANGVVYVIDEPSQSVTRLFVSDGMTLKRQPGGGAGSGSQPGGGTFEIAISGSGDAELAVEIVTDAAGNVTMGVVHGTLATKTFTIGTQGETLTVLGGADALAGYTLQNLPGTIDVEYFATLADGRTMIVTRPDVDWSYADFRVFLSTSATSPLIERKVTNFARGSFTDILFDLDGVGHGALQLQSRARPVDALRRLGHLRARRHGARDAPTGVTFLCF